MAVVAGVGVEAAVGVEAEAGTDNSLIMLNDTRGRDPRRHDPMIHPGWPHEPAEVCNFRFPLRNSIRQTLSRPASLRKEDLV